MAASPTSATPPTSTKPWNPSDESVKEVQKHFSESDREKLANQIASAIRRKVPNSPLIKESRYLVDYALSRNVNPGWLAALAGAESGFGTTGYAPQRNNAFGYGGFTYPDWKANIRAVSDSLSGRLYFKDGRTTTRDIIERYSPVGAPNDPKGTNAAHPQNIVAIYNEMFPGANLTLDSDVRFFQQGSGSGIGPAIDDFGSAVKDAASGVTNMLGPLWEFLGFLLDPKLWLRIGSMILGVIGMILGALFAFKGNGKSARPVGLLIAMFGFGWLWAGVKNVSPVILVKDVVTG